MKITETKTTYLCDLCSRQVIDESGLIKVSYPVYWNSNQTDGGGCAPYIEQTNLDLCVGCLKEVLKVEGSGVQGYKRYETRVL
jgi:hypothetical protein